MVFLVCDVSCNSYVDIYFGYVYIMKKSFTKRVLEVVAQIERGQVYTYKKVAELAGNPKAFRAVGSILNKNYNPDIPCHRVIRSDGKLGGYNRGQSLKKLLLESEYFEQRF